MPEPMAAFYFVQLLEAVTFMHAQVWSRVWGWV